MCESKANGGMGFKDLKTFNMALLAKQGWRIHKEEYSLLHRIFKANYFPSSNFKESKLGAAPSYVWRGIWEAKSLLLKGCRWRVGDGNAINIWSNYWLPKQRLIPISDSITQAQLNWTVVDLIDEYTRWWNMEKVRRLLPQREAYEVLNMMLPADSRPDSIVWEHEPNA